MLEAPYKEMIVFDTSGHRPLFEQPTGDRTVNLTLKCGEEAKGCSGFWTWYQGGTSHGSGSINGFGNTTT